MTIKAIDAKPRQRFLHTGKTRLRSEAIAALLSESTVIAAAAKVGVSGRTLQRWLAEPEFQEAYRAAQARLLDSALNVLRATAVSFAEVIRQVAEDTELPGAVRFQAASRGLELLMRAHGAQDVERQLSELEQTVAQIQMENQK